MVKRPQATQRILIVDDDEIVREIMASILQHEGYQCQSVPNGVDALTLLEAGKKFDLITSDICNLPMWGTDLLKELKRRFPMIPTLVITGCGALPFDCLRKDAACDYQTLLTAIRRKLNHWE
jgi:DNA-binding NtrC family response regulator